MEALSATSGVASPGSSGAADSNGLSDGGLAESGTAGKDNDPDTDWFRDDDSTNAPSPGGIADGDASEDFDEERIGAENDGVGEKDDDPEGDADEVTDAADDNGEMDNGRDDNDEEDTGDSDDGDDDDTGAGPEKDVFGTAEAGGVGANPGGSFVTQIDAAVMSEGFEEISLAGGISMALG